MDNTLRTIGEEIRKNREGIIPALTLVIDINILLEVLINRLKEAPTKKNRTFRQFDAILFGKSSFTA